MQEVDVPRLWTQLVRASGLIASTAKANASEQGMDVDTGSGDHQHIMQHTCLQLEHDLR